MKVLQLGPCPPPHGGVQANLSAIREALHKENLPAPAIAITHAVQAETDEEVFRPANFLQLLRLLITLDYNIIHLHIGGKLTNKLLGLAFVCCLVPKRKSVLTFHSGGYPKTKEGQSARPFSLRGFIFRRFDCIIGVNKEIIELFKKFGVASERIHLILPYAVSDSWREATLPETIRNFQHTHKPLLVTISGLEKEYDLPTQIEALGLLLNDFPNAGLAIVGAGSLRDEIEMLIKTKPHANQILLCGDISHDAALRLVADSDLFLRTTLYDGDAISVREALYLGTPVIATDNGMRPDGVELIPIGDTNALTQKIKTTLDRERSTLPNKKSGSENIELVLKLYNELLKT